MKVRNKRGTAVSVDPKNDDGPFVVEAGGVAEVDEHIGRSLLEQSDRWEPAGETDIETSVPAVLAQVGNNRGRARTALEKERGSDKPRKSLIDALTKIIDTEEG